MRKLLLKKIAGRSSQRGESLVEVLVAMTVAGLAMIMLAMAIAVSSGIVHKSAEAEEAYYLGNADLVVMVKSGASVTVTANYGESDLTEQPIAVKYGDQDNIPGMEHETAVAYEATELKEG